MRLLLPEFDLTGIQTANSSPPNSQPANERLSVDEQPCCSKDLKDDRREGMMQEREESGEEEKSSLEENKGPTEERRNNREEKKGKGKKAKSKNEERDGNEQEEKKGKEVEYGEEKKGEMETELRKEEEEEEEEEESSEEEEEEPPAQDSFIRNSGLISHSYSLDLNLSPGGYKASLSSTPTHYNVLIL